MKFEDGERERGKEKGEFLELGLTMEFATAVGLVATILKRKCVCGTWGTCGHTRVLMLTA